MLEMLSVIPHSFLAPCFHTINFTITDKQIAVALGENVTVKQSLHVSFEFNLVVVKSKRKGQHSFVFTISDINVCRLPLNSDSVYISPGSHNVLTQQTSTMFSIKQVFLQ